MEEKPSKVEIRKINGVYDYYVNGKKFIVKGVGLDSTQGDDYEGLKKAGANTFRTWRSNNAEEELKQAAKHGLMVAIGIELEQELNGFDYDDEEAVQQQFERIKKEILTYKDHSNVLCWVVGNELNLNFDKDDKLIDINPKVWDAFSSVCDFIHEVDPNHPVTTTFAGFYPKQIKVMLERAPQIDFLSFQIYGELENLHKNVNEAGISKPYMVTEYGPTGHWEMPATSWGREIEEPSGPKARNMMKRIHCFFDDDKSGLVLGGFMFFWGQKQERTPTWYGVFNKTGEATARVDELTKYWTGSYPANRAPLTESISIDGTDPEQSLHLKPDEMYHALVEYTEPDGDEVYIQWTLLEEVQTRSHGGAFEKQPDKVEIEVISCDGNQLSFKAPAKNGEYRLFAYVYDGKGKVGNANFPFYVKR